MASERQTTTPITSGNLSELLRCFICFNLVREPHMCPTCSKMCCLSCITKWITERKQNCPFCRSPLQISQLVNCRFMEDIYTEISRLRKQKVFHTHHNTLNCQQEEKSPLETCPKHQQTLQYFCVSCESCICADCAMFEPEHSGHKFEKLESVYKEHVSKVTKEIESINDRLKSLRSLEEGVDGNIRAVKAAKEERSLELQAALQDTDARLTAQLKAKLITLLGQRSDLVKEARLLESLLQELNGQLDVSVCPRSLLIQKTPELLSMLHEVHAKPVTQFYREPVPASFPSELVPEYHSSVFRIENFPALQTQQKIVFSPVLKAEGMHWRLKVYANGNGVAQGEFLSVFLELSEAIFETSRKFEYRIEMLHTTQRSRVVSRVFSSHFESGECWGYNRFFRLDELRSEGYLDADSALTFRFFVRSPNFCFLARAQQDMVAHLQRQAKDQASVVRRLRVVVSCQSRELRELKRKLRERESTEPALPAAVEEEEEEEEGSEEKEKKAGEGEQQERGVNVNAEGKEEKEKEKEAEEKLEEKEQKEEEIEEKEGNEETEEETKEEGSEETEEVVEHVEGHSEDVHVEDPSEEHGENSENDGAENRTELEVEEMSEHSANEEEDPSLEDTLPDEPGEDTAELVHPHSLALSGGSCSDSHEHSAPDSAWQQRWWPNNRTVVPVEEEEKHLNNQLRLLGQRDVRLPKDQRHTAERVQRHLQNSVQEFSNLLESLLRTETDLEQQQQAAAVSGQAALDSVAALDNSTSGPTEAPNSAYF